MRRDEVAAARAELAAALQLRPDDLRALGLFGLACFRQNAFEDALPVYQRLVELRPADASHRLNLGLVYLKVGQAHLAIRELGHSRELDPSQPRTVSYLGLAHARAGDYGQAFEAFLRSGQEQLALEMEQYLSAEERAVIRARVARGEARPPGRSDLGLDSGIYETVERRAAALIVPDEDDEGGAEDEDSSAGAAAYDDDEHEQAIEEFDDAGVITRAVALAVPAVAASATGTRVGAGQKAPSALTELATRRLIRPEEGDHPFEIGAGGVLIARVSDRILSRTDDLIVTYGDLAFEQARRRARAATTSENFGEAENSMSLVSGRGYMVFAPAGQSFTAVALDDGILYLRENLVFAFEAELRWEAGHVPGSDAPMRTSMRVVQFRGHGCVAFRSKRPLQSLKLAGDRPVHVDARVLAGWIGRVVPRVVSAPPGLGSRSVFVECSGEGVVLLEDQGGA